MWPKLRARLSFANVVSVIALFAALCGTGYAAGVLPANSVGGAQLKPDSVTSGKVKNGSLKAKDFAKGELTPGPAGPRGAAGPAGPQGPAGTLDTTLFYTKAQTDGRYLHSALVTVVASNASVSAGNFGSATASCPGGYQAIAGGQSGQSVSTMTVTSSEPLVENNDVFSLTDGQHGAPTAWRVWMLNTSGSAQGFKVMAVCAPIA
jgi:hypothetical protein